MADLMQGPVIRAKDANGYETGGFTVNPNYQGSVAPIDTKTGASLSTTPPLSTLKQLSIGLANGTITDQAGVNKLYGNEAYGSSVPGATPETTRRAAAPVAPVDPLTTLSPEQRAEFSKQFSIGLANGSLKDQAGIDSFKKTFAESAKGGVAPSIYTTQPTGNTNNAGQSATRQGDVSGAGSTAAGGSYSRYGNGMTQAEKDAQSYLDTFTAPKTAEEIAAEKIAGSQDLVNNINQNYNNQLIDQSRVNDQRTTETNARDVLNGLSGSSEAGQHATQTSELNKFDNKKIQDQKALELSTLYSNIRNEAATEARQQMIDARSNAKDILDRRDVNMTKAQDSAKSLAASGATFEGLKTTDPQTFKYLADSVGGEAQLQALFTLNRPQEDILDKQIKDGKYIIAYRNPLTGAVRMESVDLGLPTGYSKTIDAGDRILAVPDNWGGDPKDLITINKGLTPAEAQKVVGDSSGNIKVSDAAQNIIDQINLGASLDDLVKGTSNNAQKLRNEVLAGLNAQGGLSKKSFSVLEDGKAVVDAMIKDEAYKALGGYSSVLGGQFTTAYGDAMAQASQLQAILARDNLGLLKGAMSDKDLAFIQAMSSGFEGQGTQSEKFIKARFKSIQESLAKKLEKSPMGTELQSAGLEWVVPEGGGAAKQVVYNGQTYNVDANGDMTPA